MSKPKRRLLKTKFGQAMPNRQRPRCPDCGRAMTPVYGKGTRGEAFVKIRDAFWCRDDDVIGRGRRKVRFA